MQVVYPGEPQEPLPQQTRCAKITEEIYALIPQWVAQDMRAEEIAARIGCKLGTLKVRCSQRKISLRRPNWKSRRWDRPLRPSDLPKNAPIAQQLFGEPAAPAALPAPPPEKQSTPVLPVPLSRVARSLLRQRAEATGKSEAELAAELIETFARVAA